MELEFAITAFVTLFAINNPIGNIPFFYTVTEGYTEEEKRGVIRKTCLVMLAVLFVFGLFGQYIFSVYGITIPSFKVAGGLLLFSIAWNMMQGERPHAKLSDVDVREAMKTDLVGVVPLGIPMFAGPGTITTVMILVSETTSRSDMFGLVAIFASIAILTVLAFFFLSYADRMFDLMGRSGTLAFSRIMGLLLAAVAVNFILTGIFQAVADAGFA